MTPEAQLLQAIQTGRTDITSMGAWLDLFLQLAEQRIDQLQRVLHHWAQQPQSALPFAALPLADELADLCAEQNNPNLTELALRLSQSLQNASAAGQTPEQQRAILQASEELLRQLHQHAAGIHVVTPPHILAALH
jgi:tRNA 2-selenouridine synthase SelU